MDQGVRIRYSESLEFERAGAQCSVFATYGLPAPEVGHPYVA
jgi:hypothetical protein